MGKYETHYGDDCSGGDGGCVGMVMIVVTGYGHDGSGDSHLRSSAYFVLYIVKI